MKMLVMVGLLMASGLPAFAQTGMPPSTKHQLRPPMERGTPYMPFSTDVKAPRTPVPMTAPPGPQSPKRVFSGVADAPTLADCAKHIHYTSSSPVTVTINNNGLSDPCDLSLVQRTSGGTVLVVPGPGVTANPSPLGFTQTMGKDSAVTVHFFLNETTGKPEYDLWGLGAK